MTSFFDIYIYTYSFVSGVSWWISGPLIAPIKWPWISFFTVFDLSFIMNICGSHCLVSFVCHFIEISNFGYYYSDLVLSFYRGGTCLSLKWPLTRGLSGLEFYRNILAGHLKEVYWLATASIDMTSLKNAQQVIPSWIFKRTPFPKLESSMSWLMKLKLLHCCCEFVFSLQVMYTLCHALYIGYHLRLPRSSRTKTGAVA